ncbi:MAG: CehA/McbA family metallohydrolase [Trueperaceae bacterium]|nr:MAG: CehA/McbA family metallohydrolase [Trueperaceae bacterium]
MKVPPTAHATTLSLTGVFNTDRSELTGGLRPVADATTTFGSQTFRGLPFELGVPGKPNVILLDDTEVGIELGGIKANYLLFVHAVEDRASNYLEELADHAIDGNELGQRVSEYRLEYADGSSVSKPILRRFAIQQSRIGWGASPFAAVPAATPAVFPSFSELQELGRLSQGSYGRGETRTESGRERSSEILWLYALPNPRPDQPIRRIVCAPGQERSLIYAVSWTSLDSHPLRPGTREKLRLELPDGAALNYLGELEEIGIDLGEVISARAALRYDPGSWQGTAPNVQPLREDRAVIVEYAAHPQAKLYVGTNPGAFEVFDLSQLAAEPVGKGGDRVERIAPATRPVRLRIVEKGSGRPVAVRLHLHGQAGEYLPPKGNHRQVNPYWFEDNYGEFVNGRNQYAYVPGECVADLPLGEVFIEVTRGYEIKPLRTSFTVTPEMSEQTFELERVLNWREKGWVSADTHVHFLSPQTAHLEGQAEGVNVVNLLASQWGEMFSNVSDFDGKTTVGAKEFGGDGEFLVRVGTENRMQVLGHVSLLGYSGSMIHPLCSGGPSESALGDPLEVTMAEWARRCIDQGGLVVMPHAPNPQCERAADIVLGVINAVEMMTFNPFDAQINPYGLADWYRYLNLGYQLPVVGGSDKMSASSLLGGIRTYAHLGEAAFSYENWMAAVRSGNTFVTVGPLAELTVEGHSPGDRFELPSTGGPVDVSWRVESVSLPIDQVEVVQGGLVVEQVNVDKKLSAAGSVELKITDSSWIALRVRGSYRGTHGEIAAHTSAVQVLVAEKPLFSPRDAGLVLDQIEGAIAYVDTIAPRPEAERYKQLRATLESAYNRLHQRMHRRGIYHEHVPLHDHHHEH